MRRNGEGESLHAVKACSRTLGEEGVKELSAGGRSVWLGFGKGRRARFREEF